MAKSGSYKYNSVIECENISAAQSGLGEGLESQVYYYYSLDNISLMLDNALYTVMLDLTI